MPTGVRPATSALSDAARQLVVPFDRLIGIGGGAERDASSRVHDGLSSSRASTSAKFTLTKISDENSSSGPELELRLIAAGEAVVAPVRASAIGIQRPVEGHALHRIQRGSARDFLVARLVGAALRLVQRPDAVLTHLQRDRSGGGALRSNSKRAVAEVHGCFAFLRHDARVQAWLSDVSTADGPLSRYRFSRLPDRPIVKSPITRSER